MSELANYYLYEWVVNPAIIMSIALENIRIFASSYGI